MEEKTSVSNILKSFSPNSSRFLRLNPDEVKYLTKQINLNLKNKRNEYLYCLASTCLSSTDTYLERDSRKFTDIFRSFFLVVDGLLQSDEELEADSSDSSDVYSLSTLIQKIIIWLFYSLQYESYCRVEETVSINLSILG